VITIARDAQSPRSAHRDHQDRGIVIARIGIVIAQIGAS